jgi:hypothetical protein
MLQLEQGLLQAFLLVSPRARMESHTGALPVV